jgi:hypothetical protein
MSHITLLGPSGETEVEGSFDGDTALVAAGDLERATGWERKPEGLCRDDVCIPVRDARVDEGDDLSLNAVATLLRAPFVAEPGASVVSLGEAGVLPTDRSGPMYAPDFTLESFAGGEVTFSSIGAKKKLLVTWASW